MLREEGSISLQYQTKSYRSAGPCGRRLNPNTNPVPLPNTPLSLVKLRRVQFATQNFSLVNLLLSLFPLLQEAKLFTEQFCSENCSSCSPPNCVVREKVIL